LNCRTTNGSNSEACNAVQSFEPFDWSEYNSPIELPPLFDASMIPIPEGEFQGIGTGQFGEFGTSAPYPVHPSFGDYQGSLLGTQNEAVDFSSSLDEATLSSFYGSSFALMK
jgi:hypothetical protein